MGPHATKYKELPYNSCWVAMSSLPLETLPWEGREDAQGTQRKMTSSSGLSLRIYKQPILAVEGKLFSRTAFKLCLAAQRYSCVRCQACWGGLSTDAAAFYLALFPSVTSRDSLVR